MRFKNAVGMGHGMLKRGEICLWRSWEATYLGSYADDSGPWKHLIVISDRMFDDTLFDGTLLVVEDLNELTCHQQTKPAVEGQLTLC